MDIQLKNCTQTYKRHQTGFFLISQPGHLLTHLPGDPAIQIQTPVRDNLFRLKMNNSRFGAN